MTKRAARDEAEESKRQEIAAELRSLLGGGAEIEAKKPCSLTIFGGIWIGTADAARLVERLKGSV